MLKEPPAKLLTPGLRREAATWTMRKRDYSSRRGCRRIGMDPKGWRYASRRSDGDAARTRLSELAGERRRFGYRRLLSCSTAKAFHGGRKRATRT